MGSLFEILNINKKEDKPDASKEKISNEKIMREIVNQMKFEEEKYPGAPPPVFEYEKELWVMHEGIRVHATPEEIQTREKWDQQIEDQMTQNSLSNLRKLNKENQEPSDLEERLEREIEDNNL